MTELRIELITIGDEVLLGHTLDTNANWISKLLSRNGLRLRWISVVGDNSSDLRHALKRAGDRSDIILMTGGLGPTHDDITRRVLTEFFQDELVLRHDLLDAIKLKYEERNIVPPPIGHELLAEFPVNADPIPNDHGTAPGIHYSKLGSDYYSTPGVPVEMRGMFGKHILPDILKKSGYFYGYRLIRTIGKGESFLAEMIGDPDSLHPIELAFLPSVSNGVTIRLSFSGVDAAVVNSELDAAKEEIYLKLQPYSFATGDISVEEAILQMLGSRNHTLSVAESCTGGMICNRIVSVPGSSNVFKQGFITYSNEAKINQLGVSPDSIEKYGAVSEEVASEMALGAIKKANSTYSVSATGIAGPTGGSADKPVGTVCVAAAKDKKTVTRAYRFFGDRESNRSRSALAAFNLLLNVLMNGMQ